MTDCRTARRRTVVAVVATLTLLLLPRPGAQAAETAPPSGVMTVAHRGAADQAPEHTLAAVDQAVAAQADRLSVDVRLTRDGVPVLLHDRSLRRTTDVQRRYPDRAPWDVADFTLDEVRTLDAGSYYASGYTGSRVLTLDELLTELEGSPVTLTVEAKNPALYGGVEGIGRAIEEVVTAHPLWSAPRPDGLPRLLLESFSWQFLDDLHLAYPARALTLLGDVTTAAFDAHPYVSELDVRHPALTSDVVAHAHAHGVLVGTWTPNTTAELQRVVDLGADGVTTDRTEQLRALLLRQGRTWTGTSRPQRPATARVDVAAPTTARVDRLVPVTARPRSASGEPLRWQTVSFQARVAGGWRTVGRTATDSSGTAVSSLRVGESLRVRVVSGGRASADRTVTGVTPRVELPPGAPSPSVPTSAQPRPTTAGADARVAPLSPRGWQAMAGRSWRHGCPVGRAGLRSVRVSYWGFDGRRHRGELTVARRSAYRLARVLTGLYDRRLPVRSLRRVESLGDWSSAVGRTVRSGSGFGFACQRTPGDRGRVGSHARGTVVSLNPWENPTSVGGRGTPNSWWLSRSRPGPFVHSSRGTVVRLFAGEGFAWNGRSGRYAEFRDVR